MYQGYADAKNYNSEYACRTVLADARRAAQLALYGKWRPTPTSKPAVYPTRTPGSNGGGGGGGDDREGCDDAYPTVCIPSPPPDLDCKVNPYRNFKVLSPDPQNFDGKDNDGWGCESWE